MLDLKNDVSVFSEGNKSWARLGLPVLGAGCYHKKLYFISISVFISLCCTDRAFLSFLPVIPPPVIHIESYSEDSISFSLKMTTNIKVRVFPCASALGEQ